MGFIIPNDELVKEIAGNIGQNAMIKPGGCPCRCVACNSCSCGRCGTKCRMSPCNSTNDIWEV